MTLMKHWMVAIAAACSLCGAAHGAGGRTDRTDESNASRPAIEKLVRELADENFRVREQATRDLWARGGEALRALEEAVDSPDPERAIRAREVLRKIQLHITPDTDPQVVDWLERYATATPSQKSALLEKLRGKRAWRQMLKLYAGESDVELREKMQNTMRSVAQRAAREMLLKGDVAAAREFLELAPADNAGLLALAEFHRSQGTLEGEIERAKALPGRKGALWRLALWRSAGNTTAARKAAIEAGERRIAALMAALDGDPLPWLESMKDPGRSSDVARRYANIASARWTGGGNSAKDLSQLTHIAASRELNESGAALNALFLLAEVKTAEPAFKQSMPHAAFNHFDMLERIPEALAILEIDPVKPDYRAWVDSQLAELLENDAEDEIEAADIEGEFISLANFLERRGLHEEARNAYIEPMIKLSAKDLNAFGDCLGRMFSSSGGAPRLARDVALAWTDGKEERWQEALIAAFGENEHTNTWWDWLQEVRPAAGSAGRFDAMLVLFGLIPDAAGMRDDWLALLWKSIDDAPANQRQTRILRLAELFTEAGDAESSLAAWKLMSPETREMTYWGHALVHLSAAGRWAEAAELIQSQINTLTEAGTETGADLHAYAAAALRAAGNREMAARHESWADQLSLGQASTAIRIGNGFSFGGDFRRAAEWWKRAVMLTDPDSEELSTSLKFYCDALLAAENWPLVASTSELQAALYAVTDYLMTTQLPLMRLRLQADMARALTVLAKDRGRALALLENCHRVFATDGSLADYFIPALRKAGLTKQHDDWFRMSWRHLRDVLEKYPESENTLNTAAWFATRALRELDAAGALIRRALELNPRQAAYLDTMAEYHFALGQREAALGWSQKAVNSSPEDTMIRRQQARFRDDPFPD
jgi:hypothetical protein